MLLLSGGGHQCKQELYTQDIDLVIVRRRPRNDVTLNVVPSVTYDTEVVGYEKTIPNVNVPKYSSDYSCR